MDEKSLIAAVKGGDYGAFEILVKLHHRAVYSMVYRYLQDHSLTDDTVQETFIKAFGALASFREESTFRSWVIRIGINNAKNVLRAQNVREYVDIQDQPLSVSDRNFKKLEEEQLSEILNQAVRKLPEKQRQALELRIFEDLSFKEIADVMGSPFDTAKANFRHGLINLRKLLEKAELAEAFENIKAAFEELDRAEDSYET